MPRMKPARNYHTGVAKKKKATVKKPKDGHSGDMKKAMKFVSSVKKAMMAYSKK